MADQPTSPQAAPAPSPQENDRQKQIDAVRAELEELKDILKERDEVKGDDTADVDQQDKLDLLDKNVENQIKKTAQVFMPIIEAKREEDKDLIDAVSGEKEILDASTLFDKPREQYNEAQSDLLSLAKELNASHLDDEIKALEGNPEKNPPSFMATLLVNIDEHLQKISSSNVFGERGKGFTKMIYRGMSQFVLSLFEKFSSINIDVLGMKYKHEWMMPADKNALADRIFADQLKSLNGMQVTEAQKEKYYAKYLAWLDNQKGDRPSLLSIVADSPVETEVAEADKEENSIFEGDKKERDIVEGDDIKIALGSDLINLGKKKVSTGEGSEKVDCSFVYSRKIISVDKITRGSNTDSMSSYRVEVAGGKSFTITELKKALDVVKETGDETPIANDIFLKIETA